MDKILYIIVAAAVLVFTGGSILFLGTNSVLEVAGFTQDTEELECEYQADSWEGPEDEISPECIEELPDENQQDALAAEVEPEIT